MAENQGRSLQLPSVMRGHRGQSLIPPFSNWGNEGTVPCVPAFKLRENDEARTKGANRRWAVLLTLVCLSTTGFSIEMGRFQTAGELPATISDDAFWRVGPKALAE